MSGEGACPAGLAIEYYSSTRDVVVIGSVFRSRDLRDFISRSDKLNKVST